MVEVGDRIWASYCRKFCLCTVLATEDPETEKRAYNGLDARGILLQVDPKVSNNTSFWTVVPFAFCAACETYWLPETFTMHSEVHYLCPNCLDNHT